MRNIKLLVEYDGTNYVGWQRQKNGISIQEKIEDAAAKITCANINLIGAGRTDAGVHARGQVANFFTDCKLNENDLKRALNAMLPDDIVIHSVAEVDEHFSARYSAKGREYKYYLSNKQTAIERNYVWQIGYLLNINIMNDCCEIIKGVHDFQAFCKSEADAEHYRCNVEFANWEHLDNRFIFTIIANRFLHGMVRALVGTMVNVGRGHTAEEKFQKILDSKNRQFAGQSAPAKGLFLNSVIY